MSTVARALSLAMALGIGGSPGGAPPTVAVSGGFASLPTAGPIAGQYIVVTGQSGMTNLIVRATGTAGAYTLLTVHVAEASIPAAGASADTWYSSGGITVTAADGAWLYDTTHKIELRWWPAATLGCDGLWVPPYVYAAPTSRTLVQWCTGTEDNATLQTLLTAQGYTSGYVASPGGGTATVTSDGTKINFGTTCPGSGGAATAYMYYNDVAGTLLTSTANVWMRGLYDLNTPTGNESRVGAILLDGAQGYDVGSARYGGSTTCTGRWFNAGAGGNYAPYAAQTAGDITVDSETLMEFEHRSGFAQVRFGGSANGWSRMAAATARTTTSKQLYALLTQANQNGVTAASASLRRHWAVVWS